MNIARFTTLIHQTHAQIKELEELARAACTEANTLEKRHAALQIDVRNAVANLAKLEEQRVQLEADLKEKAAKLRAK